MRTKTLLSKAATYFVAHSAISGAAITFCLFYVIVPFLMLHHQVPDSQMIGETKKSHLLPSQPPKMALKTLKTKTPHLRRRSP